jgi:hypothetical protein
MSDQTKLLVHFLISKLVILAVPILNGLLAMVGITVTTSNSTTDSIANYLCIGIGLAYSYWNKTQAEKVHTQAGFSQGVQAASSPGTTISQPPPSQPSPQKLPS